MQTGSSMLSEAHSRQVSVASTSGRDLTTANIAAARCRRSTWRGTYLHNRQQTQQRRTQLFCVVAKKSDVKVKPAYNKYRSRSDIQRDYINSWKEITARDGRALPPLTILSVLRFVPYWLKYVVIPEPLRFMWFLVWSQMKAVEHRLHRQLVLQGAQLDMWLANRAGLSDVHFSRALVLKRYHRKLTIWKTLSYRWQLIRGQTEELVYAV